VEGDVSYGRASAEKMAKYYQSEALCNSEDDIRYAILSVKDTLFFALKTRTPGKASRGRDKNTTCEL
jgi:hypothetical protein